MTAIDIPIVKGKTVRTHELDEYPQEVYLEALKLGFKELYNRGMSQVTKKAYPDAEELQAKANEIAEQNHENIMAGKIRFMGGAAKSKVSGVVMNEARRLARNAVKDGLRESGWKVSTIPASEITRLANELLAGDDGPGYVEEAKNNLDERAKKAAKVAGAIDLKTVKVSDKLVKAAEEKKAKAKAAAGTSAKQAGMVQARSRGQGTRPSLQ